MHPILSDDHSQVEYKLLQDLSPLTTATSIASAYGILLAPMLRLFRGVLGQLSALIKKSLQKFNFLALSAYDALLKQQSAWEELLSLRSPEYQDDKSDLREGLQSLRQICLRSFPEFLVDLKLGANDRGSDTSVRLADLTTDVCLCSLVSYHEILSCFQTVKYVSRIPQVQAAASSALLALGDGNWKMGEGVQVGKSVKGGDVDEIVILEHFLCTCFIWFVWKASTNHFSVDVVMNAINSLTTVSRTRRPIFGSIFLVNNIAYLRRHLLLHPDNNNLPSLLSQPVIDALNSNWRTAKAAYFDTNFTPLMQAITDDPKEKSGKSQAKEKFTRFYDLLDEVVERHRLFKVLDEDKEARSTIADELVMLVVPSLKRFTQKQKEREFSRSESFFFWIFFPPKYIVFFDRSIKV